MIRVAGWMAMLAAGTAPAALAAQAGPATPQDATAAGGAAAMGEDEEAIVVTGQRQPGSVVGDVPPEVQLTPADVRSYGVSSIAELLNELSPQTGSGRGRGGEAPVVLLNGRRISGFREIRDIPTEAIARVDILPEEVALKYGYGADQRVVNFVLRRRFRAVTAEGTGTTSTDGGGSSGQGELNLLRIQGDGRLNLALDYTASARLLESQRDIIASPLRRPFSFGGNIAGTGAGGEIDPALSALAGRTVVAAAVPAGAQTLAAYAGTAGQTSTSDISALRTLRPATDQLTANAVYNRTIFGDISATANASLEATGSTALRGPGGTTLIVPGGSPVSPFAEDVTLYRYPLPTALRQTIASETAHGGFSLNGSVAKWQWTLTGNYERVSRRTATERGVNASAAQSQLDARNPAFDPFGALPAGLFPLTAPDRARSVTDTGDVQAIASGTLLTVPAGNVSTTVKLGGGAIGLDSRSTRAGVVQVADLSRRTGSAQVNLDVPITSRRNAVLDAVGDVTVNLNGAVDRLSDFGTLTTIGYGLSWKPTPRLNLIWSTTEQEGAPGVSQVGDPAVTTPDVRVFDYRLGQTVFVSQIDGGNPTLTADDRSVTKLGATWRPAVASGTDLTLSANYIRSRIRDAIATLPAPTAEIEAAFPDRFLRDAAGSLVSIDARPVNFARQARDELRWGFNVSRRLTPSPRLAEAFRALRASGVQPFGRRDGPPPGDAPAGGPPPGDGPSPAGAGEGGPPAGPRPGGGGPRGGGGGRLQFALYHTVLFRDDILIRPGVPVLDLLDGSAAGGTGGSPRHRIEAQAGYNNNGIGARLSVNYQTGTTVAGGVGSQTGDLRFSSLATANLRLFADFGQIPSLLRYGWARGMRVTLAVTNLTNQRIDVRTAAGTVPLGLQRNALDPIGRELRLSIRKLFF